MAFFRHLRSKSHSDAGQEPTVWQRQALQVLAMYLENGSRSPRRPWAAPEITQVCETHRRLGRDPVAALIVLSRWLHRASRLESRREATWRLLSGRAAAMMLAAGGARLALKTQVPEQAAWGGPDVLLAVVMTASAWGVLYRLLHQQDLLPAEPVRWLDGWLHPRSPGSGLGLDLEAMCRERMQQEIEVSLDLGERRAERLLSWVPLWEIWAYWGPAALLLIGPVLAMFQQA